MRALAVIFEQPKQLHLKELPLVPPGAEDVVVEMEWSGISTGTERLLWSGRMPHFPGMGYPLVPGYESVGRVVSSGTQSGRTPGERVFVPGARCFGDVRGLFGGAASCVVVPGAKALPIGEEMGQRGVMLALAATARHAVVSSRTGNFDLIVGHGALGRLIARIVAAEHGSMPTVWETNADRMEGEAGYRVVSPEADTRHDYRSVCDASGDPTCLDRLIARLAPGGEVTLAGFYDSALSFAFPPAFMRETKINVAAQWQAADLQAVVDLAQQGRLSLDGLISHVSPARSAAEAYDTAFTNAACLKMVLDWRTCS